MEKVETEILGKSNYWISDVAWGELKRGAKHERLTMRGYIEKNWVVWTLRELDILDNELRSLWELRGREGREFDDVMWRAMWGDWGRRPRTLGLSPSALRGLAGAALVWKLPRRSRVLQVNGLAAMALEVVGRGWTKEVDFDYDE